MNLFERRPEDAAESDEDNRVEGERHLSPVNKGISLQNRLTNWAVMGGACLLAAVLLYKYYANVYDQYQQKEAPNRDVTRTVGSATLPPLTMPDPGPDNPFSPTSTAALPPLTPPNTGPAAGGTDPVGHPPAKTLAELIQERRLKREVRFNLDGGGVSSATLAAANDTRVMADATASPSSGAANEAGSPDAISVSRSGPIGSRAYVLPDSTLIMTRGRTIPCTIIPAINTSLSGMVTCVTAEDATGTDHTVSLMDRGTRCTGVQGGGVVQGQRRVGIIWQRCETPQHVLVPLDSGASDALGRPGMPGAVNNHFWDRFGAAIALSLIADVGPYLAASRQAGSNNTTIGFPTIAGPQEVVSEVLKSTVNIAPTITAAQGAQVLIYLAVDIDFRDVYQLKRTK